MQLDPHSILRRLPPGLSAKEMVALDAVRHSVDALAVVDERLRSNLTLVTEGREAGDQLLTLCFLDAWSFIDAADRVRSMAKLIAGRSSSLQEQITAFMRGTESVRKLRNLADHLDSMIDRVITSGMPALGRLSWVTVTSTESAIVGVLQPGSVRTNKIKLQLPSVGGRRVRLPTGLVQLAAGQHVCWFDEVLEETDALVSQLEHAIEAHAVSSGVLGTEVARNLLAIGEISFQNIEPVEDSPQARLPLSSSAD